MDDKTNFDVILPNGGIYQAPDEWIHIAQDGKEIGRISWEGGFFHFTGDADKSARVFFEAVKPMVDSYIEQKMKVLENK